jgi:hypothetical protein
MELRVDVASVIAQEDIVSGSGKLEGNGDIWLVVNPGVRLGQETMLAQNCWCSFSQIWLSDSLHGENVAVLGRGKVFLEEEALSLDQLPQSHVFLRVGSRFGVDFAQESITDTLPAILNGFQEAVVLKVKQLTSPENEI